MFKSILQYKKWGLFLVIFFSNALLFSHETVNLENAWQFKAKNYYVPGDRTIVVFSPPRTGSTLVFNVLQFLFSPKDGSQPAKVRKTHSIGPPYRDQIIFIPIRNPIDSACSICRLRDLDGKILTEKLLDNTVAKLIQQYRRCLEVSREYPQAFLLKYEENVENINSLIQRIEKIFGINVHEYDKELLNQFFNKEAVLTYIQEKNLKKFSQWDKQTQIHGNHIASNDDLLRKYPDLRNQLRERLVVESKLFEELGYFLEN